MKNLKKVFAVIMAVALIVTCFAACGGNDTTDGTKDEAVLKIGVTGPLTGDYAQYGLAVKYGAELAAAEINEAGGINGMKIEILVEDDTATPEGAQNRAWAEPRRDGSRAAGILKLFLINVLGVL